MTKEELKQLLKENLKIETTVKRAWFDGQDGCVGYYANVVKTTLFFDRETISCTETKSTTA